MNHIKSHCLVLVATVYIMLCGCKPETAEIVNSDKDEAGENPTPVNPELSARDQAINAAPSWNICNKGGYIAGRIKNVPGYITDCLGFRGKEHPFINIASLDPYAESTPLLKLLDRAHSFEEYVSLLKENGYTVVPTPHNNENGCVIISTPTNNIIGGETRTIF